MIPASLMYSSVRDCLGSSFAEDSAFTEGLSRLFFMQAHRPDSLASFSRLLEDYLFNALYDRLGPGMTLRMDDGSPRRIYMSDLPSLADELIFPFFADQAQKKLPFRLLHDFWLESGSFSAMRALYLFYRDQLPDQEQEMILRIVRENVPPARQDAWFSLPSRY